MKGIEAYVQGLLKIPLLTTEVELDLARRAQAGDARARERLIHGNMSHVAKVALKWARKTSVPLDELVSAASEGLLIAVGKFDPARGFRLVTYAGEWMMVRMQDVAVTRWSNGGKIQRSRYAQIIDGMRVAETNGLTEEETYAYVAKQSRTNVETVRMQIGRLRVPDMRLDAPLGENGEGTAHDFICDRSPSVHDILERDQEYVALVRRVQEAVSRLPPRIQVVVRARLMETDVEADAEKPPTLGVVGRELGVSRERVRQLERDAIERLRQTLARTDAAGRKAVRRARGESKPSKAAGGS